MVLILLNDDGNFDCNNCDNNYDYDDEHYHGGDDGDKEDDDEDDIDNDCDNNDEERSPREKRDYVGKIPRRPPPPTHPPQFGKPLLSKKRSWVYF